MVFTGLLYLYLIALHVSENIKETEGISYYQYYLFIKGKAGNSREEKFQVRCLYGLVKNTAVVKRV
jgi:hypothetical protein